MPSLKFNIGISLTATVTVGGQVLKQFGLHNTTSFKNNWSEEKETPTNLGGLTIAKNIFGGYNVTIKVTRQNGVMDALQQLLQDNYLKGNPDPVVTILKTVRNDDGSVDQENYVDGTIRVTDGGDYTGTAKVSQTVEMFFPRKIQTAATPTMTAGNTQIPTQASTL